MKAIKACCLGIILFLPVPMLVSMKENPKTGLGWSSDEPCDENSERLWAPCDDEKELFLLPKLNLLPQKNGQGEEQWINFSCGLVINEVFSNNDICQRRFEVNPKKIETLTLFICHLMWSHVHKEEDENKALIKNLRSSGLGALWQSFGAKNQNEFEFWVLCLWQQIKEDRTGFLKSK